MKNKLKQITDLTIQEVLGNEIILPSTYFKIFDKNIKKIDKNLKNENVSIDNTNIILEEFNSINKYFNFFLYNNLIKHAHHQSSFNINIYPSFFPQPTCTNIYK